MIFTIPKRHNEMKINKVGLLVIVFLVSQENTMQI